MSVVAGPFLAAAGLLGAAGSLKLLRPAATAQAMRAAGLPGADPGGGPLAGPTAARLIGAVEVAVAAFALVAGGPLTAALVAAAYLVFALFSVRLLRTAGAGASCGCFGAEESPASPVHVWVNLIVAALAAVAVAEPVPGVRAVLADSPLGGAPFLLATVVCGWLLFAVLTAVPDLRSAIAGGRGLPS